MKMILRILAVPLFLLMGAIYLILLVVGSFNAGLGGAISGFSLGKISHENGEKIGRGILIALAGVVACALFYMDHISTQETIVFVILIAFLLILAFLDKIIDSIIQIVFDKTISLLDFIRYG